MTEVTLIYVLSHIGAAGLGYLGGRYATRSALRTVVHKVDPDASVEEAHHMSENTKHRLGLGIWLLVGATVLIGIGLQSVLAQKSYNDAVEKREKALTCLAMWSNEFTNTITQRSTVSDEVAAAQQRRENALDSILLLTYKSVSKPDSVDKAAFEAALKEFVDARSALMRARGRQDSVQQRLPYPDPPSELCKESVLSHD